MEQQLSNVTSVLVDLVDEVKKLNRALEDIADAQRGMAMKHQVIPPSHRK